VQCAADAHHLPPTFAPKKRIGPGELKLPCRMNAPALCCTRQRINTCVPKRTSAMASCTTVERIIAPAFAGIGLQVRGL
jgi:hypothetical protein